MDKPAHAFALGTANGGGPPPTCPQERFAHKLNVFFLGGLLLRGIGAVGSPAARGRHDERSEGCRKIFPLSTPDVDLWTAHDGRHARPFGRQRPLPAHRVHIRDRHN